MKGKFAFTKGRLIGFICCALLPVFAITLGILMLTKSVLFNVGFAITYFLIPLITAALLAWCIFAGSKTLRKVILSGVILVLFAVLFVWSFIFTGFVQVKHYEGTEAEMQYAAVKNENALMPELSEIGQSTDIEYHNVFTAFFVFSAETDYLICCYTPDEYEIKKAELETDYAFQEEIITGDYSNCEPSVEIDGYQFRLLSVDEYKGTIYYPKNLVLIGFSDATKEIVYVVFEDFDLDYISSLKDFITDDCGWKYIR